MKGSWTIEGSWKGTASAVPSSLDTDAALAAEVVNA